MYENSCVKQESHRRQRSAWSPVRSVTSSTVEQKHVGQTSVQLAQERQRVATSSQRGCSGLRYSKSLMPAVSSATPHGLGGARHDLLGGGAVGGRCRLASRLRQQRRTAVAAALGEEAVSAVEQLGQDQIEAARRARARLHGHAEARAARLPAIDRDQQGTVAPRGVVGIDEAAVQEDPILDGDGVQLACARADERQTWKYRLLVADRERIALARCLPQLEAGYEEELLPGVRAERIAEQCVVSTPLQAVRARVLHLGPASREVTDTADGTVHNGAVADGRTDELVPVGAHGLQQRLKLRHGQSDRVTSRRRLSGLRHAGRWKRLSHGRETCKDLAGRAESAAHAAAQITFSDLE